MTEQGAPTQSVERSFRILELLCQNGAMGVTELARAAGLHKTTVYRLLSTLVSLGYAEKHEDGEKYEVTLKLLRISAAPISRLDIRNAAASELCRLSDRTGETVHLVKRSGNDIVYIDKFEAQKNAVRMVSRVGLSLPMICTAVGKAILARCDDGEVARVWQACEKIRRTDKTILDFTDFMREIELVRRRGYATDCEENEVGVTCVAAALPDIGGVYRYAVSVSAPTSRMQDTAEYGACVMAAVRRIAGISHE